MSLSQSLYLRLPVPLKQAALDYYGRKLEQLRYPTAEQHEREWGMPAVAGKSCDELRDVQNERLTGLVRRAQEQSPFWAERLAGRRIENEADLEQVAPLGKSELRAAGRAVICRDIARRDLVVEQTSGSTGSPMTFYQSKVSVCRNYVFYRSFRGWHGYRPGDRRARFGARLILPASRRRIPFWLYDRAQDTIYLSLYHMSEETLAHYAEAIADYGPTEISGYPSNIHLFADWCLRHGETRIRPRRVLSDAETLLDYQRETIEAAFGCRVTNCYGLIETGMFAAECPQGTMHVFPHLAIVEVLDEVGHRCVEGEVGAIHVTSFVNNAAPLIRYNTGDRGSLGPIGCACGLQGATLASLDGRSDDVITTATGRRVPHVDVSFFFRGDGEIRECQLVQLAPGRFRFLVVPGTGFGPATFERARAAARSRLGPDLEVSFRVVDRIPRGANGKFRAVVVRNDGGSAALHGTEAAGGSEMPVL